MLIQPNLSAESFADLDSEVVTPTSFSNYDIIIEVIEGKNEESEDDQDDEESTPPKRPSPNEAEDALETLRSLSMFSTRGDEIRSLVLNMESLLVRERIDNLKQCCTSLFSKEDKRRKKLIKATCVDFYCFYQTFRKLELLTSRTFFKVPREFELSRVNCVYVSILFDAFSLYSL